MSGWLLWALIACGFGAGEVLTTGGFFLAPFAIGALLAAAADALLDSGAAAFAVFIVSSVLTLALVRPIARKHLTSAPRIRTGAAALIGRQAIVLERIANHEGVGCVKIDGEVWTARAFDEDQVFEPGQRVEVLAIRGATALVSE